MRGRIPRTTTPREPKQWNLFAKSWSTKSGPNRPICRRQWWSPTRMGAKHLSTIRGCRPDRVEGALGRPAASSSVASAKLLTTRPAVSFRQKTIPQLDRAPFAASCELDDANGNDLSGRAVAIDLELVAYIVQCLRHRLNVIRVEHRILEKGNDRAHGRASFPCLDTLAPTWAARAE